MKMYTEETVAKANVYKN